MLTPKVWPKLLRSFLPKCLVLKTGPVSSLVTEKYSLYEQFPIPSLVAVATQCVNNRTREVWLKHSRSSQLTDLFRWLGNRQVARSALAVLDLASCCQSESLLRGFVRFLLGHNRILQGRTHRVREKPVLVRPPCWDDEAEKAHPKGPKV
jgi:hypothetical protein